jgi:hypothetical protein
VLLEGDMPGFGTITSVRYDNTEGKFIINERKFYIPRITAEAAAALCRAIHSDDRIGVSIPSTRVPFVYGSLPPDSRVARDLLLADRFLGDMAYARPHWIAGYKFVNGFLPRLDVRGAAAALFTIKDFKTREDADEVATISVAFTAMLIPISASSSAGDDPLPDMQNLDDPILQHGEYARTIKHITDNISYYRRERIIDLAFRYAEFAAFARTLEEARVDLARLADSIHH